MSKDLMYRSPESNGQTVNNRLAKSPPEEPDASIAHVRVCEGPGRRRPGLLDNCRERFLKVMNFETADHPIYWEVEGFLGGNYGTETGSTIDCWRQQGLSIPLGLDIREYFGFDHFEEGVNLCLVGEKPIFKDETIEETDEYRVWRAGNGVTMKRLKKTMCMPQFIDYPIKDRQSWAVYKKRLEDARRDLRLDAGKWESYKKRIKTRDHALGINAASLYGRLRDLIGTEQLSMLFYDDPGLVHEMMEYFTDNFLKDTARALDELDIDYACLGEDIAFKNGPLISPAMFREFMAPLYRKVTACLRSHGIKYIFVDSDGDINSLIPLWLECGVNGFYPLEVNAGMDPVQLRKKYGRDIILLGGVDKMPLIRGDKAAIKAEVMKKLPYLFSQGGYIGGIDHGVPPDVSFESYSYYAGLVSDVMYG